MRDKVSRDMSVKDGLDMPPNGGLICSSDDERCGFFNKYPLRLSARANISSDEVAYQACVAGISRARSEHISGFFNKYPLRLSARANISSDEVAYQVCSAGISRARSEHIKRRSRISSLRSGHITKKRLIQPFFHKISYISFQSFNMTSAVPSFPFGLYQTVRMPKRLPPSISPE